MRWVCLVGINTHRVEGGSMARMVKVEDTIIPYRGLSVSGRKAYTWLGEYYR